MNGTITRACTTGQFIKEYRKNCVGMVVDQLLQSFDAPTARTTVTVVPKPFRGGKWKQGTPCPDAVTFLLGREEASDEVLTKREASDQVRLRTERVK